MEYFKFGESVVIRLDQGDEVVASLSAVAEKERIMLGAVTGIGAVNRATLGLFRVAAKSYVPQEYIGDHEIVSLSGTVSRKDDLPYLHLHMAIGDENMRVFGGHLSEAYISATAEIVIHEIRGQAGRKYDPHVGLYVLDFPAAS